jgi:hypothetical protein
MRQFIKYYLNIKDSIEVCRVLSIVLGHIINSLTFIELAVQLTVNVH